MQVRMILVLVGLAFCMSTQTATAQGKYLFARTDFSRVDLCTADEMPKVQDLPKGYQVWTKAGRAPLLPEFLTTSAEMVHMVVAFELTPEYLNSKELEILQGLSPVERSDLEKGRAAWQLVQARYLFTPRWTLKGQAPTQPSSKFRQAVSEAMRPENLERIVVPCGTVLKGMSFASTLEGNVLQAEVDYDPYILGWKEKGAVDKETGKGGAWMWQPMDGVYIEDEKSPFAGMVVKPCMIGFCGNGCFDTAPFKWTTTVDGTSSVGEPQAEPRKPAIFVPVKLPPPQLARNPPPPPPPTDKKHKPCTGPKSRWVCTAIVGGVAASFIPYGGKTIYNRQPPGKTKTGGS